MKILSGPLSMFGAKAQIALLEKGIPHETEMVPFSLAKRYEPKHPDVARINPKKQVPVLIKDALELFDSTQIFEYLEDLAPDPALWPTSPEERALARKLELTADEVFFPQVVVLMQHWADLTHSDACAAIENLNTHYLNMDRRLAKQNYLAGDYSYADIAFFMAQFFAAFLGGEMSDAHKNLKAWRLRLLSRPAVASVIRPMCQFLIANNLQPPATEALHLIAPMSTNRPAEKRT